MNVVNYFVDWCFWNKIDEENISVENKNRFISYIKGIKTDLTDEVINAILKKYYSYIKK